MKVIDDHFCEELNSANFERVANVAEHQVSNANGRRRGHQWPT